MSSALSPFNWTGRLDAEDSDFGRRVHQVVQPFKAAPGISLIGLASDLGVQYNQGRLGARDGPAYFRQAFANLAWHFDTPFFDIGDYSIRDDHSGEPLAHAQTAYAEATAQALNAKQFVLGIGGGHEIGWASYLGCRYYLDSIGAKEKTVAILNFDAHFDLRCPPTNAHWLGSSGTPFYQASIDCQTRDIEFRYACLGIDQSANTTALFNYAKSQQVDYLLDEDCDKISADALIEKFLDKADYLYVTICLDALPAHVASGVSAPAALGVSLDFVIHSLKQVEKVCAVNKVNWLMADIAELNPRFDIDQRTAKVAARLAYEIIQLQNQNFSLGQFSS